MTNNGWVASGSSGASRRKRNVYQDSSHLHVRSEAHGGAYRSSIAHVDISDTSTVGSLDSDGTMLCLNACVSGRGSGVAKRGRKDADGNAAPMPSSCMSGCFADVSGNPNAASSATATASILSTQAIRNSRGSFGGHGGANMYADSDQGNRGGKAKLTDGEVLQAMDMHSLSIEERRQAEEDLHGVTEVSAEEVRKDPAQIEQKLAQLSAKLTTMRYKSSYDTALFLYPRVTRTSKLRLAFLRAVDWDVDQAARRIVAYYQHKQELFGTASLGRDRVSLHDEMGDEQSQQVLQYGAFQMFPNQVRDQVGRPIYFQALHLLPDPTSVKNMLRCFFYVLMGGIQEMDELDQTKGLVCVLLLLQNSKKNLLPSWFWDFHVKSVPVAKSLPIKIASCHMCCDSPHFKTIVSLMQVSINKEVRVRFRPLYASYFESMYSLSSFGIDKRNFPLNDMGDVDAPKLQHLLRLRQQSEQEQDRIVRQELIDAITASASAQHIPLDQILNGTDMTLVVPNSKDVLMGRGRSFQNHVGNIRLSQIVQENYKAAHNQSTTEQRVALVEEVRLHIKQDVGGRFLKKTPNGLDWMLVSDEEEVKKVKNTFRSK
mmetsp:Transcript_9286/g.26510  ORF Transcript_9286/g.26510 Transcript_9286/m.26510 type:complete len:599 (-) Transcript_9286:96-1892(-)